MPYADQFPGFVLDVELPAGFEDTSWKNDACPSFRKGGLVIWIEYADISDREFPEMHRFNLQRERAEGDVEDIAYTDAWSEIVAAVAQAEADQQQIAAQWGEPVPPALAAFVAERSKTLVSSKPFKTAADLWKFLNDVVADNEIDLSTVAIANRDGDKVGSAEIEEVDGDLRLRLWLSGD